MSSHNENYMSKGAAAFYIGYQIKTLQRFYRENALKTERTKTNRRVYKKSQLDEFFGKKIQKKRLND